MPNPVEGPPGVPEDMAEVPLTDEADRTAVLATPQAASPGKCDDQGLGTRGWPFSCLPDPAADRRESGDHALSTRLDQLRRDAADFSRPPLLQ